ncbi:MAG: TerB family tellurite resistance protein [Pseudomonadota bacterium]|nr:TerB family tellurite resistance protein [Pseudomonadota bacterium]
MHILIGLLVAAAGAFWAFRYFTEAAREGREALRDVKGLYRSGKWSRQIDRRLIENLSDPREAAAVLLYQIASYDGAVTDRQKAAMVGEMRAAFGADTETAEGLSAFARMALGQINDAANSLKKILRPVNEACTVEEKRALLDMMLRIAEIEGPVSDVQHHLIGEARRILLPD